MPSPEFSPNTLTLFRDLLGQLQIPASHPQIEAIAAQVACARRELEAAIEAQAAPEYGFARTEEAPCRT